MRTVFTIPHLLLSLPALSQICVVPHLISACIAATLSPLPVSILAPAPSSPLTHTISINTHPLSRLCILSGEVNALNGVIRALPATPLLHGVITLKRCSDGRVDTLTLVAVKVRTPARHPLPYKSLPHFKSAIPVYLLVPACSAIFLSIFLPLWSTSPLAQSAHLHHDRLMCFHIARVSCVLVHSYVGIDVIQDTVYNGG